MITPEKPLRLETGEIQSPLWVKLKRHLEQRLAQLRQDNDGELSPEATAKIRGKIAAIKECLELETEFPMSR